jgi:hypothetical protein
VNVPLAVIEDIIDASGIAGAIEELLPAGVRGRQLSVRTLLAGMHLALADVRPAHLTRVHAALTSLPGADQARLGVTASWETGPHQLTYRQVEHTFALITAALAKAEPDGAPARDLQAVCDKLLEATIPAEHAQNSAALAADWTDIESWSRPPRHGTTQCADPEARWGHRNSNLPGPKGEMFFGYYLSAVVMTREENSPAVPELARRITLCSCHLDPARALVPVLTAMPAAGIPLGDIIADSGYAHRDASAWATPLRNAGASLIQDLHPHDRGPRGTHQGAIIANGNLYCPATPGPLLQLGPAPPGATTEQTTAHDQQTTELARHKLGRHTTSDTDGYHRVTCPAAAGKIRYPLRPDSMTLDRSRPEILSAPEHPPACCTQQTITIPPGRGSQDPPETRLPLRRLAPLLQPAHSSRTQLLHHQRHRHHHHRPGLDPPHRPHRHHALDLLPARRPQPAHPHRMEQPPGRQHPPRRRRTPAQTTPQTQARHHRGLTPNPTPRAPPPQQPACPARRTQPRPAPTPNTAPPQTAPAAPAHAGTASVRPKCEHRAWSNVKTTLSPLTESNRRPSPYH